MSALQQHGFVDALREATNRGAYVLGICLGMQLLFESSEEGVLPGLGLVPGRVEKFKLAGTPLKVPHVGWNIVRPLRDSALFSTSDEQQRFYHVHSYHAVCGDSGDTVAVTQYGYEFACAVQHGKVLGVQFHPEKSHRFGVRLMQRFVGLG
jgi:glutamine amidotransferase